MSFILDALKKSEAERRQGEIPSLQNDSGAAAPRRRSIWPFLLFLALLLNGAVFGGWLLFRREIPPLAEMSSGGADRLLAAKAARPAPVKDINPESAPRAEEPAPVLPAAPVRLSPQPHVQPVRPAVSTPAESPSASPKVGLQTKSKVMEMPAAAPEATTAPQETRMPEPPQPVQPVAPTSSPAEAEPFPLLSELPADVRSGLPGLSLQLHFFSREPASRLVRLNGFNLREGEQGGDGLSVVEITLDGIRLSCRGVRFFLPTARR